MNWLNDMLQSDPDPQESREWIDSMQAVIEKNGALRAHQFAGLGYHSPNMQLSHSARLPRKATGFDQESIATLVLSGRYLGFLPDN